MALRLCNMLVPSSWESFPGVEIAIVNWNSRWGLSVIVQCVMAATEVDISLTGPIRSMLG